MKRIGIISDTHAYWDDKLEVHRDAIKKGDKVAIVDDL